MIKDLHNPSPTELACKMNIAKASISAMIERLEKNNFLYKVTSDSDRRSAHVHLTEKGKKAASLHTELHKRIADMLIKGMTASEKEILIVLLNKSIKSLNNINKLVK
jgi:DNA-binding MarR family transcriptional regulator